jgi:hypothetical protein
MGGVVVAQSDDLGRAQRPLAFRPTEELIDPNLLAALPGDLKFERYLFDLSPSRARYRLKVRVGTDGTYSVDLFRSSVFVWNDNSRLGATFAFGAGVGVAGAIAGDDLLLLISDAGELARIEFSDGEEPVVSTLDLCRVAAISACAPTGLSPNLDGTYRVRIGDGYVAQVSSDFSAVEVRLDDPLRTSGQWAAEQ